MVSYQEKSAPVVIANKTIRIGLFGARADDGGLGNETFEFFRHIQPDKTLIVDISKLTGKPNNFGKYRDLATYPHQWSISNGFPTLQECKDFLTDLDVVICYETPYNYDLFKIARDRGIKTILRYNYEFLDYLNQPKLPLPDILASPSLWHLEDVESRFKGKCEVILLFNPIARDRLPFREVNRIETFLHVAGTELYEDRNGTNIVLQAISHIMTPIRLKIFSQHPIFLYSAVTPPHVDLEVNYGNVPHYWDLYREGDCLLLPRRYGGQSLQLNEAMSTGMIPVMLNIPPQNNMLDPLCLIPTTNYKSITTRTKIECYDANPKELAQRIDMLANLDKDEVFRLNIASDNYAEWLSWTRLRSHYYEVFEKCTSQ